MNNLVLSVVIAAALLMGFPPTKAGANPEEFVQRLSDEVVGTLKDAELDSGEKLANLKTALDEAADLELLAKLILGRYWRSASADEKDAYVAVFRQLVNKTMADRLSDYGGETIEVIGSKAVNERDTMVNTLVHRPSGAPPYKVDWRVRQSDSRTAVIDVVAEGVSLVVTQRSEIGDIAAKQGMGGLIEILESRLEQQSTN